jgi:hypothetical protein
MANSRFKVSLRICHPSMDPDRISSIMGMTPRFSWKAGDRRKSRRGTDLPGARKETYWCAELCEFSSPPRKFAAELDKVLDKLQGHRDFLLEVRKQGGRCEFFIGWFCAPMDGGLLPHTTLAGMADLGIDLALNIYAEVETDEPPPEAIEASESRPAQK